MNKLILHIMLAISAMTATGTPIPVAPEDYMPEGRKEAWVRGTWATTLKSVPMFKLSIPAEKYEKIRESDGVRAVEFLSIINEQNALRFSEINEPLMVLQQVRGIVEVRVRGKHWWVAAKYLRPRKK